MYNSVTGVLANLVAKAKTGWGNRTENFFQTNMLITIKLSSFVNGSNATMYVSRINNTQMYPNLVIFCTSLSGPRKSFKQHSSSAPFPFFFLPSFLLLFPSSRHPLPFLPIPLLFSFPFPSFFSFPGAHHLSQNSYGICESSVSSLS